jgi:hypothetical protein
MSVGPIPPPFPKGKGAGWLMVVLSFQVNDSFQEALASPPWGRRERGLVDLTPIVTIDRRVGWTYPPVASACFELAPIKWLFRNFGAVKPSG